MEPYRHRREDHRHCDTELYEAAEVLGLCIMVGLQSIADALSGGSTSEPEWVARLEERMGATEDAVARIEASLSGLSDEVGQVIDVLNELQNREDPAAAIAELGSVADRLDAVKDSLESATTLDDPDPEPEPAPEEPPATPDDVPPATGDTGDVEGAPNPEPDQPPPPGVPNDGGVIEEPAPPADTDTPTDPVLDPTPPEQPNEGGVIEAPPTDGGDASGDTGEDSGGSEPGDQPPA